MVVDVLLPGAAVIPGWLPLDYPATLRKIEEEKFFPDEIRHIDIILGGMAAMVGSPFVATLLPGQ